MREGIGSIFLYNLIAIFIVLIFVFIAGTVVYYKAFKVNNMIVSAIEKYEGYNNLSAKEIDQKLGTIGYQTTSKHKCYKKNGKTALEYVSTNRGIFDYCVYEFNEGNNFRSYGVMTFITIDMPVIGGVLKLPVYSKTKLLYNFG
jgi:hypothetical protein